MDPRAIFGEVFSTESVIAAVVFALVALTLVVAIWRGRRRRKRNSAPSSRSDAHAVELCYGLAVAAVVGFVIYLSLDTNGQETAHAQGTDATVNITGFQWCWRFSYPGHDVTRTGTCRDLQHSPTMVVPVGQPVTVRITSDDVIHSWWVPHLRYKLDAFPNHVNTVTFKVDHAGTWIGRCAEFCGNYHFKMDFHLRAVSPSKYRAWLASGGSNAALSA